MNGKGGGMSRKRRHIHAKPDEWIVVHRAPPSQDSSGCGCLILILIILFLFLVF